MGNFWDSQHGAADDDVGTTDAISPLAGSEAKLSDLQKDRMAGLLAGPRQMTVDELLIQLPSALKPDALDFLRKEMLKRRRNPNETYALRDERLKREAAIEKKLQRQQKRPKFKVPSKITAESLKDIIPLARKKIVGLQSKLGFFEFKVGMDGPKSPTKVIAPTFPGPITGAENKLD